MHRAAVGDASDAKIDVRQEAVRALGEFDGPSDLTLLKAIAKRDTARSVRHDGRVTYVVREEAQRTIAKLSARMAPPKTP